MACSSGNHGGGSVPGGAGARDPVPPEVAPDGVEGTTSACRFIDVVIALDDSMSMTEERDAMRSEVFPAFARAVRQVGNGDVHVRTGVLDACPFPADLHTRGASGPCNFWGGHTWMLSDSPRLVDEYSCVGEIYQGGHQCTGDNDDEQPASTIGAALESPATAGGFMRDGALLVGLAITDEDEQPTPNQSAQAVHDRLVALKGGDVMKMAFLGIGATQDCDGVYGSAREAAKLKEITSLFVGEGRGLFWDLCDGSLEQGLAQVVQLIDRACDEFCADPDGCTPGSGTWDPDGDRCTDSDDCPSGEVCQAGVCQPGGGACDDASDCPSGYLCEQGGCQPGAGDCDENNDCPSGELCEYGTCQPILD
jgi:hypothetical protein